MPLGPAHKGTNRFRWNRKVAGKRLKRGNYLLTYRTLKGKRVTEHVQLGPLHGREVGPDHPREAPALKVRPSSA